jgi:hypothetical protein
MKALSSWNSARWLALFPLVVTVGCVGIGSRSDEVYEIRRAARRIRIDGDVEAAEWAPAQVVTPEQICSGAERDMSTVRLLYDEDRLYVGIRCIDSQVTQKVENFWKKDSLMIYMRTGVAMAEHSCIFRFAFTPQGVVRARYHRGPVPPMRELIDYTKPIPPKLYEGASAVGENVWSAELALLWSAIAPAPVPPRPFHFKVSRRDIDGDGTSGSEWPYDKIVVFEFQGNERDSEPATRAPAEAQGQ